MWTRAELKERAKACLKKYYWAAFVVSLIFGLVSGFGGNSNSSTGNSNGNYEQRNAVIERFYDTTEDLPDVVQEIPEFVERMPVAGAGGSALKFGRLFWGTFAGMVILVLVLVSLVLSVFIAPVLEVGKNRFYMESRLLGRSAGVGKLFWGFSGKYLNIVWAMFLRNFFIVIGTLLCVIPGIYLEYCYYLVPYILAENPEMKPMEAMRLSKEMMDGHKFNTFVLGLSFIGWYLLGILACGIGGIFVNPYVEATTAELYAVLRGPYSGGLNGFGMPDVVPSGGWGGSYVNPDHVYDAGNGYGNNGGYGQGGSYGNNGGYSQGSSYGNSGYSQGSSYGNNSGYSQGGGYGNGGGYSQGSSYGNGGGYSQGGGYGNSGSDSQGWESTSGNTSVPGEAEGRETDVSRSEGGPGKGYYLNGVFYPYSDDEK